MSPSERHLLHYQNRWKRNAVIAIRFDRLTGGNFIVVLKRFSRVCVSRGASGCRVVSVKFQSGQRIEFTQCRRDSLFSASDIFRCPAELNPNAFFDKYVLCAFVQRRAHNVSGSYQLLNANSHFTDFKIHERSKIFQAVRFSLTVSGTNLTRWFIFSPSQRPGSVVDKNNVSFSAIFLQFEDAFVYSELQISKYGQVSLSNIYNNNHGS